MKKFRPQRLAAALALASIAGTTLAQTAATPPPAPPLPEAHTLIERYISETGGQKKFDTTTQATMTGTFSMPAANLTAPMTIWMDGPQRLASKVELPGLGAIQGGIHGETVWSMDPFQGARILEGVERAQQIESVHPDAIRKLPAFVDELKTEGSAQYDGKACYKVAISWKSGRKSWECYGIEDGLLLASGGKQNSPMGEIEMLTVIKEYRMIDGMKVPVVSEITSMGQKQVMRVEKIESGKPPAEVFELPAAVKALATATK